MLFLWTARVCRMDYVYAIVLGVVQGVAEFLPISSSGHLVIAEAVLAANSDQKLPAWLSGMTMNVALHFGTLLSIAVVYWRDLLALLKDFRLMLMIVIASIPVGVVGLMFKDQIEAMFDSPLAAAGCLLITAAFLMTARVLQKGTTDLAGMSTGTAIVVGIFQAIAILPGISRAGSTVSAGMICGLRRPDAARFSFFIALPAIGGATLLETIKVLKGADATPVMWQPMLLGTVISFVVGVLSLKWLLRMLVADRLHWFAAWCLIVAVATITWQLTSPPAVPIASEVQSHHQMEGSSGSAGVDSSV